MSRLLSALGKGHRICTTRVEKGLGGRDAGATVCERWGRMCTQVSAFRKRLEKVVGDKHEEVMARMGAIMATGLLDAGGRNLTVGLRSASGYFRRTSVVGLMLFLQYWYWYPLSYCISLALQPSAVIALNADLKLPRMQVPRADQPLRLSQII